jgi:lysozyme
VADQFDRWVYAKGKKLPGLVKRRAEEKQVFLS